MSKRYFIDKALAPFLPITSDIHAHLIPGIDDGPQTMEEAVNMVNKLQKAGYEQLTATPHVFLEYYPNTKEQILKGYQALKMAVSNAGIDVEIKVAAEYFLDDHFLEILHVDDLLTINENSILVELSLHGSTVGMTEIFQEIREKEYMPILAHPERYLYLEIEDYRQLLHFGCQFQVNLLSLVGYYGVKEQKRAHFLFKKGWVTYLGTDAHNEIQVEKIDKLLNIRSSKNRRSFPKKVVDYLSLALTRF